MQQHSGLTEGVSGAGYALDELRVLASPAIPFVPSARDVVTQKEAGGAGAILARQIAQLEILLVTDALQPDARTVFRCYSGAVDTRRRSRRI